jgi:hypothetical protein
MSATPRFPPRGSGRKSFPRSPLFQCWMARMAMCGIASVGLCRLGTGGIVGQGTRNPHWGSPAGSIAHASTSCAATALRPMVYQDRQQSRTVHPPSPTPPPEPPCSNRRTACTQIGGRWYTTGQRCVLKVEGGGAMSPTVHRPRGGALRGFPYSRYLRHAECLRHGREDSRPRSDPHGCSHRVCSALLSSPCNCSRCRSD